MTGKGHSVKLLNEDKFSLLLGVWVTGHMHIPKLVDAHVVHFITCKFFIKKNCRTLIDRMLAEHLGDSVLMSVISFAGQHKNKEY